MKQIECREVNWNREICLSLTLKELQVIYDSVGCSNQSDRRELWDENNTECICYDTNFTDGVYEDLEEIIVDNGGVTH